MHSTSRNGTVRRTALRTLAGMMTALVAATGVTIAGGTPAAAYTPAFTFAGITDWDGDGHADLVGRDRAGLLWLYPGESRRGYSGAARVRIGHGWSGFTFAGIADWDGDGHADLVGRDSSGRLWLYPGESTRAYSTQQRVRIGNGWNGFTFAGVADWDGDGNADVVARDSSGRLWLYPGESTRAYSGEPRVRIGHGWNGFTFADTADWDGDGNTDVVARDNAGRLWLYLGESKRGYSDAGRVQIGNGW